MVPSQCDSPPVSGRPRGFSDLRTGSCGAEKRLVRRTMVADLVSIAVKVMDYALKHPNMVQGAANRIQSGWQAWSDRQQVLKGRVNLDSQQKAIEKACQLCIRKSEEEQRRVVAFVAALYLQHGGQIERAAQVGGSLRKKFGVSWFPHVAEHELRFALDVDPELEGFVEALIREGQAVPERQLVPTGQIPGTGTSSAPGIGTVSALPTGVALTFRSFLKGL